MQVKANIKILGVCGSLADKSNTLHALKLALDSAKKAGAQTSLLELRSLELPLFNSVHTHANSSAYIEKLKAEFKSADGFILSTPEYHGSVSGALKNALDHMGFDEFEGKMVGLLGIAGGALGAAHALDHLRTICRQLHAWVVPIEVSIANSREAFDKSGKPIEASLNSRLEKLGSEVARFSMLHNQEAWKDFVRLWEKSVQNPGG